MFQRNQQGAVEILAGSEPLNVDQIDALIESVQPCLAAGQPQIVIDLKAIPLIDSAGLNCLLDLRDDCVRRGGMLKLACTNHLCRDILRITGVEDHFEVYGDVISAAGSFAE